MRRRSLKEQLKNIWYGFGSVFEIWPAPQRLRFQMRSSRSEWMALCHDGGKIAQDWGITANRLRSELTHAR